MRISEIFYSIQGEGELTGVPSVFVRTTGCNLRCRWCDTKYASWDPSGEEIALSEILDYVKARAANHVVLTGGEPMVAKGVSELAQALKDQNQHVTIETAATVSPDGIVCDLASLSPKLSNSTPGSGEIESGWIEQHEARRLRLDVIDAWMAQYNYQLKFVVASQTDLKEIDDLLGILKITPVPHKVLLMPEGVTTESLKERDAMLVEHCKQRGFRYCRRLHVDLFGNTPGT